MSWLENLFLILTLERHSIIYVLLFDLYPLDGLEFLHWINVLFYNLLLFFLLSTRLHQVWHALYVIWPDVLDL